MSASSTSGERVPRGTRDEILKEINRLLGKSITVDWVENLGHAGESITTKHLEEVIRLATTSVDPLGVAHHEALHVLLERIKRLPDGERLIEQLVAATSTAPVRRRLEKMLAADPGALRQLDDPIERLAYAFQLFRADPKFRFSPKAQSWFEGLKAFLRKLVGRMTNAEIADRIFDAFAAGTFSEPSLMNEWFTNRLDSVIPDSAVAFMNKHPLMTMVNAVKSSGDAFMRETGIPAYAKLADAIQAGLGGAGGFLPERLRRMAQWGNRLNDLVKNATEEELREAHENLLLKKEPSSDLERGVRKLLDDFYGYLKANRVQYPIYGTRNEAGELQVLWKDIRKRNNYYPGVWDAEAIKKDREGFDKLLQKYGLGKDQAKRSEIIENAMAGNESEHGLVGSFESGFTPFMQATSERSLDELYDDPASLKFRNQNMVETLQRYIYQGVHRAEYVSRFGNRGEKLRAMLDEGIEQGATSEQQKWARMYAQAAEGTLGSSIHPELRDAQGWMLLYQNMRLLPLAIFSQFVDPLTIAMRSGDFRTAIRAFSLGLRSVFGKLEPSEMQRIAETVGAIDQQSALETMGQMTGSMYMSKTQRSISDKFFKAIGMTGWNNGMRLAAFEAAYGFLKEHTFHPKTHSKRWLKELGLQEGDVQLDKNGNIKLSPSPGFTKEKAERVRMALNKWVNSTIVRPTAADRPIWASSPYFALVFHLKQFTYSFHRNVIKYVFREAQHGNYWPLAVATSYVPTMMASDFLRGMIQGLGEEPEYKKKWTMGDRMWNAVQRSGFTGVPQFALDSLEDAERGHTGLETLMGPSLAQTSAAIQTVAGSRDGSSFVTNALPGQVVFKHW